MFNRDIPVYVVTGFLEGGKTRFLNSTAKESYFAIRGKSLIISCEQGEEEYDIKELRARHRTEVVFIEDQEDFTEERLRVLDKQYKPERVLIEFNPLWSCTKLYEMKLPRYWDMAQHIVVFDASTFQVYSQNMMPLITEMIKPADMVIFNRASDDLPLGNFRRSVKVSNPATQIMFEGEDGKPIDIFKDEMPFDIDAPVIEISDEDFGIWYVDVMDNPEKYVGKKVSYKGQVLKSRNLKADFFVPGRQAMTCCADDMQFIGYVNKYAQSPDLKEGEWVKVTGTIHMEEIKAYNGEGPVVHVENLEKAEKPEVELVYFT